MYAIIETGAKQYKVQPGDEIYIEKLDSEVGETVNFKVIALNSGNDFLVGSPYLDQANVSGTILKKGRTKKISVFTYKPKKNSKRKKSHRQHYTKVQIESVN